MEYCLGFHRNCPSHDTRDQPRHGNVLGHLEVERDGDHGELIPGFNSCWALCHCFLETTFKLQSLLRLLSQCHGAGILGSVPPLGSPAV